MPRRESRRFLKMTTLHVFKYLCGPIHADRICWLLCCCACVCCAGTLCAALWTRFQQVPALLTLVDIIANTARTPMILVCPSVETLAKLFQLKMPTHHQKRDDIVSLLSRIFRNKIIPEGKIRFLHDLLKARNMTLPEGLMSLMPPCRDFMVKCRWQEEAMDCEKLFKPALTSWGVCCLAWPKTLNAAVKRFPLILNPILDILLQSSDIEIPNSFDGPVSPIPLLRGDYYKADLKFWASSDYSEDVIIEGYCHPGIFYSREVCFIKCKERKCGCSDPIRTTYEDEKDIPPPCSVTHMNCLRHYGSAEKFCDCPQECNRVTAVTMLNTAQIYEMVTFDPLFSGANASTDTLLSINILTTRSKVFEIKYTETWWSLLSSFGGVFSMFLGVGLFSAWELVFFLVGRLPAALRQSSQRRQRKRSENNFIRFTH